MTAMDSPAPDAGRRADTEQLIGALIPPIIQRRLIPDVPASLPPLPPRRLPAREAPHSLRLDIACPDASGRLSTRRLLRILNWSPGDRIDHTVVQDAIIVNRSATGRAIIGVRGDPPLPATARALAGIDPDGQALLVAAPGHDTLVVHPLSIVATLLTEYYARQDSVDGS